MTRRTRKGTTVIEIEFQNYVMHKIEKLTSSGDFLDAPYLLNYAVIYASICKCGKQNEIPERIPLRNNKR
jgi:hypothetical protein